MHAIPGTNHIVIAMQCKMNVLLTDWYNDVHRLEAVYSSANYQVRQWMLLTLMQRADL